MLIAGFKKFLFYYSSFPLVHPPHLHIPPIPKLLSISVYLSQPIPSWKSLSHPQNLDSACLGAPNHCSSSPAASPTQWESAQANKKQIPTRDIAVSKILCQQGWENKQKKQSLTPKGNSIRMSWVKVLTLLESKRESRKIGGLGWDEFQLPPKCWRSARSVPVLMQNLGQLLFEEETRFEFHKIPFQASPSLCLQISCFLISVRRINLGLINLRQLKESLKHSVLSTGGDVGHESSSWKTWAPYFWNLREKNFTFSRD